MSDRTVIQRGTDTSGRPIRATRAMWAVWDACCAELGFEPTIVQGGFMGDDSAAASATTHLGDAFDVRLWDRTDAERAEMIRVFRNHALAYWERYESQGFDLHAHMVPGPWASPAPGALYQWNAYLDGRNGLASNGPDYHWRPSPLVTEPPEDEVTPDDIEKIAAAVEKRLTPVIKAEVRFQFRDLFPKGDLDVTVREAIRELLKDKRAEG